MPLPPSYTEALPSGELIFGFRALEAIFKINWDHTGGASV